MLFFKRHSIIHHSRLCNPSSSLKLPSKREADSRESPVVVSPRKYTPQCITDQDEEGKSLGSRAYWKEESCEQVKKKKSMSMYPTSTTSAQRKEYHQIDQESKANYISLTFDYTSSRGIS